MEGIISGFSRLEAVKRISLFIDEKKAGSSALIKGLFASSKGFFFCSAVKGCVSSHVHVIVEDSKEAAEYMCNDLYPEFGDNVFYFPSSSSSSSRIISIKDSSNKVQRSITLSAINRFSEKSGNLVIVTYPDPLKEKIVRRDAVSKSILTLKPGDNILVADGKMDFEVQEIIGRDIRTIAVVKGSLGLACLHASKLVLAIVIKYSCIALAGNPSLA